MTYDVQRYSLWQRRYPDGEIEGVMKPHDLGQYVLAADAEAHERAAVEAVRAEVNENCKRSLARFATECREQAIRDCIAAVESLPVTVSSPNRGPYLAALRALLDGGK